MKQTLPEKKQGLSTQVINKDEKIFEKEEHQLIYNAFLKVLKDKAESKEITDNFISAYKNILLSNVNPEEIKPLSEENFCQFLLSVFEKIREKKLANEENLKNGEIEKVVAECMADIRGTEAKDSLIKLIGLPIGVKIDPKNILGSIKDGLLEKVPFFGKGKKEEDEPPLSDEEMVTTFLRKSLLPVILFSLTTLIFGTGPIMLGIAVTGLVITEVKVVKSLFSNDKKGTLYNPHSQDKNDTEKREKLNGKILKGINDILKIPVEGDRKSEHPTVTADEQIAQGRENNEQLQSFKDKEDKRRQAKIGSQYKF